MICLIVRPWLCWTDSPIFSQSPVWHGLHAWTCRLVPSARFAHSYMDTFVNSARFISIFTLLESANEVADKHSFISNPVSFLDVRNFYSQEEHGFRNFPVRIYEGMGVTNPCPKINSGLNCFRKSSFRTLASFLPS